MNNNTNKISKANWKPWRPAPGNWFPRISGKALGSWFIQRPEPAPL